jgi:diketogulonate reductase-like aldo/keto reductase
MASTSNNSKAQPSFIYGTAWKKNRTKRLVKEAIVAGFRRVDTAAQPRHYQEHLVGEALRELYSSGTVTRSDIYVRNEKTTSPHVLLISTRYKPSTQPQPAKI